MSNFTWNDYNDVEDQMEFETIPDGTLVKVQMQIKMGGYFHPDLGFLGGYPTKSKNGEAVFLECKFGILSGKYADRVIWDRIGLYSPTGPAYSSMGAQRIKAILNSRAGLKTSDKSAEAMAKRAIKNFPADLDNSIFVVQIGVEIYQDTTRNKIKRIITADDARYESIMNNTAQAQPKLDTGFIDDSIPF